MFLHSLLQHFLAMMVPLHEASVFQTTKRKRITSAVATSTPGFPSRATQGKKQLLHLSSRLSPEIWSNLSRIWLTRSAIQEFHRRKVQPARPKPKNWLGSTYNGGSGLLRFFTMYLTQPADPTGQPTYHIVEIKSFILTGEAEACHEGIEWFRNSRDFTEEVRDGAIASAKKMAHDRHDTASSSTSTNHPPESSSTSEFAGPVPGSWLGGLSTSQAQESLTRPSGSGHAKPRRSMDGPSRDAGSSLEWRKFLPW